MKREIKQLEELADIVDSLHQTPKYSEVGLPMVRVTEIKGGYLNLENTFKVEEKVFEEFSKKHKSQKGDIVMSRVGTYGISSYVADDTPFCLGQNTLFILPKIDNKYLYYSLIAPNTKSQIEGFATGASQKTISLKSIKGIKIPIPIPATQRKIASILSAYDDLIENNLKRIKLLEEKAFLMYKGIVRSEKMNEYLIEEVCETFGGGTPATGDRRFWDDGEILWFSPTDLTKHHSIVLLDSEKKITEMGLQKSSAKLVPPKTILMTSRASIGYFGLINKPASTNQGFINIIPFNVNHRAYMLFDLKIRKEEIIGNANGSTFLEISKGKFRQMKIKLPKDEKVLIDFEKEFELIFNFIENLLKQNSKLREARDILLPRLMNGQIEV